ncbi:zinc finger, CCHC-type containing protein [Tanacetum coccineum]
MYVLTTPIPEDGKHATVEQIRKRAKWDNDDYVCRGLILNGMYDPLFDIYQNVESSKELWDSLKAKYMAEDASSKKFLVSNFTNYKMTDSRPIMEQYNELLDFKHTLKHKKEELTLVELRSHLRIEESHRVQDNDKPTCNNVAGPSVVNMVEHNNSTRYTDNKGKCKYQDTKADPNNKPKVTYWKCGKPGHLKKDCKCGKVGNKANGSCINGLVDSSTNLLKGETVHMCKDRYWFKTYKSLNDGFILHMRISQYPWCMDVVVFSTWMAFRGNTRDLGSFGEETDEITDLHQIFEEVLLTERGDSVADESIYDAWACFKNLIQRVPHHGLDLWSLTQFFYDHVDNYTRMDLDFVANGNLRELSGEEAWEAIENLAQGKKEWDNPPNIISKQEVANLKAQAKRLFGNENVWVEMHRGFYAVLSSDLSNKITYRKFLIKNGEEIFTDAGDGVRIYPDGVASPAM